MKVSCCCAFVVKSSAQLALPRWQQLAAAAVLYWIVMDLLERAVTTAPRGSCLLKTGNCTGKLSSPTIARSGNGKDARRHFMLEHSAFCVDVTPLIFTLRCYEFMKFMR